MKIAPTGNSVKGNIGPQGNSKRLTEDTTNYKYLCLCVHSSKILNNGVHESTSRRKPLLSDKQQCILSQVCLRPCGCSTMLLVNRTNIELFNTNANTMFGKKHCTATPILITSVKHGGGSIMVWGCLAASGPVGLAIIGGTIT